MAEKKNHNYNPRRWDWIDGDNFVKTKPNLCLPFKIKTNKVYLQTVRMNLMSQIADFPKE